MNYSERDAERVILLVPDGEGGWTTSESADPLLAIVRRFGVVTGSATSVTSDATLYAPASGNGVRLRWLAVAAPAGQNETVVTVKLGSDTVYEWPLSSPSGFAHASVREGAADGALTVELVPDGPTAYVNYELEEYTP